MVKRVLGGLGVALLLLVGVLVARTLMLPSRQEQVPAAPAMAHDDARTAQRLAELVRLRTIAAPAGSTSEPNAEAFRALAAALARHYPAAHRAMTLERVNEHTLLYTWVGTDTARKPVMLMAHQDVVPVAPGTEGRWRQPPFDGVIAEGFVWGRGAWDDKGNLVAIMEAVEVLAAAGFRPARTVHLVFGHDEEVGGRQGAQAVARLLAGRGVRLEFVLDEGLLLTEGVLKGLDRPAALVGIAEKGILTLEMTSEAVPGHSSMPSERTAVGALAQALVRMQSNRLPAEMRAHARQLFETLAPEMGGINRLLLSNLWLFGPLVSMQLEKAPATNAMMRTTMAPTVLAAGERENVLPGEARALVNFRLLPGDSSDAVLAHAKAVVADEATRIVKRDGVQEASRVSATDAPGYRAIARAVRALHPDAVVAPGLMLGATDARHLEAIADQVYRFSPIRARPEDLPRFHGTDERLSVTNLGELVRFYRLLLEDVAR